MKRSQFLRFLSAPIFLPFLSSFEEKVTKTWAIWEYTIVTIDMPLANILYRMGLEGWELCSKSDTELIFKRLK